MFVRNLFDSLVSRLSRPPTRRSKLAAARRLGARRLLLEGLEDRRLLAFDVAVAYPVGVDPRAVVAGEFNGDGSPDLAVTGSDGPVRILLGNGDGTLRAAGDYLDSVWGLDIAAGDLKGDGALQLRERP